MIRKLCSAALSMLAFLTVLFCVALAVLYLLGIRPYVVRSGSMEPALQTGSLCFVNSNISFREVREGDVAAFRSPSGGRVVHRVVRLTGDGLETKGDANEISDGITITEGNYMGKAVFSIPKLGRLFAFLQSGRGKILCLTVIACLLIRGVFLKDTGPVKKNQVKKEDR